MPGGPYRRKAQGERLCLVVLAFVLLSVSLVTLKVVQGVDRVTPRVPLQAVVASRQNLGHSREKTADPRKEQQKQRVFFEMEQHVASDEEDRDPMNDSVPDFQHDAQMLLPAPGQRDVTELKRVRIFDLHPTQLAVGMQQVDAKREMMEAKGLPFKSKKLEKFLIKHPLPVVKGPGGGLYLIDHHHLSRALLQLGVQEAYYTLVADWSSVGPPAGRGEAASNTATTTTATATTTTGGADGAVADAFWERMADAGYLWDHDERGNRVGWREVVERLPSDVTGLVDDPYRSLAAVVRKAGGYDKAWVPFAEFQWANFFRDKVPVGNDPAHPEVVGTAMALAAHPGAAHLPGHKGSSSAP